MKAGKETVMKYPFNYTKRFKEKDSVYAFDYAHLALAELDELYNDCFDYYEETTSYDNLLKKWSEDEIKEATTSLEELFEEGYYFSKDEVNYQFLEDYNKGLISLPPVHQCNLQCSYCFADQGKVFHGEERSFTLEQVEKTLRFIYYNYMKDYKKYRIDFVSGGEPLLNFDVIRHVKQVSDKLYEESKKPMELWLCTNGTLLTDEIIKYLDENNINIGISLDGDESQHDLIRRDVTGQGTYQKIVNNIARIKNNKELTRHTKDIWGLVVITSKTKSLVEILKHHESIGLKNVQMKIVRLEKDSEYAITKENLPELKQKYDELFDFFHEELNTNSVKYIRMILNDNDFAGKIVCRLLLRYVVQNRCQAGKSKVSIAANGDLYPCDSFVGMEEYKLGNINGELKKENPFLKLTIQTNDPCSNCWARYLCGGDCYHNSCLVNESIYKPDEIICEVEQHVIRRALIYLNDLTNRAPSQHEFLVELLEKRQNMLF